MSAPSQTAQEALGGDRTSPRPWHVELGDEGAYTAIVDSGGRLVADTDAPAHGVDADRRRGTGEADAELICRAVNAYVPTVSTRAAVELATVRETRTL